MDEKLNEEKVQKKKKEKKPKTLFRIILKILGFIIIILAIYVIWLFCFTADVIKEIKQKYDDLDKNFANEVNYRQSLEEEKSIRESEMSEYEQAYNNMNKNKISKNITKLDISFLKLENQKENKIYSPLSIKCALKMLEAATSDTSKEQISNLLKNAKLTKYNSNENMTFANAIFVRNNFKESIKQTYIDTLKNDFGAEVIFDSFESPDNINSWVSNKTFNLIDNLLETVDPTTNFALINSLAINMEWDNKFSETIAEECSYWHEAFGWDASEYILPQKGTFGENKTEVSGMKFIASLNNYDIVTELGEETIKKTVTNAYKEYLRNEEFYDSKTETYHKLTEEEVEKGAAEFLPSYLPVYIEEINTNYKEVDYSTDFSLYVDNNIKVFAKDLEKSDSTTLQYVGIMPIKEDLDTYINSTNERDLTNIIHRLKTLETGNFKEGVVTRIIGYVPKFNFEYELNLKEDLQKLGITDVFEEGKANLTNITDDTSNYIDEAVHKANIEFTQDGIKAAASTYIVGKGAGGDFDYLYEVPVETIDLTFDKPYLFLIRDKDTGEIWFTGTVYEPLLWEDETGKESVY